MFIKTHHLRHVLKKLKLSIVWKAYHNYINNNGIKTIRVNKTVSTMSTVSEIEKMIAIELVHLKANNKILVYVDLV